MTITEDTRTTQLASWQGSDAVKALRAIRAAAVSRGNDRARPALLSVELSEGLAVATDSYTLAMVPLDYAGPRIQLPEDVVTALARITLAEVRKAEGDPSWSLSVAAEGTWVEVTYGSARCGTRTVRDLVPGPFPTWKLLVPAEHVVAAGLQVALNPALLARLDKMATALAANMPPAVLVHAADVNTPVVWELRCREHGTVTMLQMPVRIS